MEHFAEYYPDIKFIQRVARELPWYHHVILMERIKTKEEKLFYIENSVQYGWLGLV